MMKMTVVGELPWGCLLDASWCIRFALIVRAVGPPGRVLHGPTSFWQGFYLHGWRLKFQRSCRWLAGPMSGEHVGRLRGLFTL